MKQPGNSRCRADYSSVPASPPQVRTKHEPVPSFVLSESKTGIEPAPSGWLDRHADVTPLRHRPHVCQVVPRTAKAGYHPASDRFLARLKNHIISVQQAGGFRHRPDYSSVPTSPPRVRTKHEPVPSFVLSESKTGIEPAPSIWRERCAAVTPLRHQPHVCQVVPRTAKAGFPPRL